MKNFIHCGSRLRHNLELSAKSLYHFVINAKNDHKMLLVTGTEYVTITVERKPMGTGKEYSIVQVDEISADIFKQKFTLNKQPVWFPKENI